MKITSVKVDGAGRFSTPVSVQGLGDGVNVLAAGNEAGKSTLFRAVRACIFERHTTTNRLVARLSTEGFSLPLSVALGFTHKGDEYAIEKCFIRSPSASLRKNGVEIARGKQADEVLWEVLGIEPGSGRSVDEAAFGLLWVDQGHSISMPAPSGTVADTLNALVHEEVGALVGGDRARAVLNVVKEELDQYLTDRSKPKTNGPLGRALRDVEQTTSLLTDAQQRLQQADQQILALEQLARERATLSDPALLAQMQSELTEADASLTAAQNARSILVRAESDERQAAVGVDNASRARAELNDCAERIDTSRVREKTINEEHAPFRARYDDAERAVNETRTKQTALGAQAQQNETSERALNQLATAVASNARRTDLADRLKLLHDIGQRVAPIEAELDTNRCTADLLERLDDIQRELSTLAARLEAGAAQISVEIGGAGIGQVQVDGQIVQSRVSRSLTVPVVVKIGDFATVEATPPAAFGATEYDRRGNLERELSLLLEKAGSVSPEQLRQGHARRRQLESSFAAITAELKAVGVVRADLPVEVERVTKDLAAVDKVVAEALSAAQLTKLPGAPDIEKRQKIALNRREEERLERERLGRIVEDQTTILTEHAASMGELKGELDEIGRRCEVDLAMLPDNARMETLAEAQQKLDDTSKEHGIHAAALLNQRNKTPDDAEVERIHNRYHRLKSAMDSYRDKLNGLDLNIAKLEGQISAVGAEGLGERVSAITEELGLCTREAERLRTRVDMLQLLSETIERRYREQRDRLNAPLLRHLQPFLNDLFPNAAPEIGDGFTLTGLRRDGPAAERIDMLSDGTQEQIAVLVRLAMGSMICERGEPVPIILDDALVFSDDDRIERMFDALTRAGQRQQVIVLTCRLRAFASLGGRQLSLVR